MTLRNDENHNAVAGQYATASILVHKTGEFLFGDKTKAAASVEYLLDALVAAPIGAYSLRKLREDYAGSAIRVKRTSDNSELDIGFDSGGGLDTAAVAFGSNLELVKWYDQSTAAKDLFSIGSQAVILIPSHTNGKPALRFGTSNAARGCNLRSTGNTFALTHPKMFIVADAVSTDYATFQGGIVSFGDWFNAYIDSSEKYVLYNGSSVPYGAAIWGLQQLTARFLSGDDQLARNGSNLRPDGAANSGDGAHTEALTLGNYAASSLYGFVGYFQEFVLFDGAVSNDDDTAVIDSQMNFFSV